MAFLDKVSDLGKSAAKKSGEMLETTKMTIKISEEKSKIKDVENELGKYYYSQYLSGAGLDANAAELCEKIKAMYESIEELQKQKEEVGQKDETIDVTGAGKFCPHCGAKQSGESKFCGSCGGKLEG